MRVSYFIPILAALISLSGALLSLRQARRASRLTTSNSVGDALLKLNQLFIDEPELWPYIVQGKKPIPKKHEAKAKVMAVMILNILESIWSQRKGMEQESQESWKSYIRWQVRSVEIILEAYKEDYAWYPNLQKIVEPEKMPPGSKGHAPPSGFSRKNPA